MRELRERPYEHQAPRRPSHLPHRVDPPPERSGAPDLRFLLFVGGSKLGDPSSANGLYLVPASGGEPGRMLQVAGACCAAWQPVG